MYFNKKTQYITITKGSFSYVDFLFLSSFILTTLVNIINGHSSTPTISFFDTSLGPVIVKYSNYVMLFVNVFYLLIISKRLKRIDEITLAIIIFYSFLLLSDFFGYERTFSISSVSTAMFFVTLSISNVISGLSMSLLRNSVFIYLILNIFSIFLVPEFSLQYNYDGLINFRMHGIANQANSLAPYSILMIYLTTVNPYSQKALKYLAKSVALITLALTQSKTTILIGIMVMIIGILDKKMPLRKIQRLGLYAIILAVIALIVYLALPFSTILSDDENISTFSGRDSVWSFALDAWRQNPIFGYGYSSLWNDDMVSNFAAIYNWSPKYSHSLFVQILSEAGLFGIFGLVFLLFCIFHVLFRSNYENRFLIIALFGGLTIVRGISEVTLGNGIITDNSVLQIILLCCIFHAIKRKDNDRLS